MTKQYKVIHKKSNVMVSGSPKLPSAASLEYGELAINYAAGGETLSIKNANDEIVTFSSDRVQVDWNASDSGSTSYIKNKPDVPTEQTMTASGFTKDAITGIVFNGNSVTVTSGIASIDESELPSVTGSDEGKVLAVVNSAWTAVTPTIVYGGSATPDQSLGNNGDIYLQSNPVVIYETDGTTGLLGHNNNSFDNQWQLENLDLSGYKYIQCYFKAAATGDSSTFTPAVVVTVPLDEAAKGPTAYFGGVMVTLPFNRNREYMVTCAVDGTKTKFQVVHQNTLWDITTSDANNTGRYLYKIEAYA